MKNTTEVRMTIAEKAKLYHYLEQLTLKMDGVFKWDTDWNNDRIKEKQESIKESESMDEITELNKEIAELETENRLMLKATELLQQALENIA